MKREKQKKGEEKNIIKEETETKCVLTSITN